jgi:hypothetical protein
MTITYQQIPGGGIYLPAQPRVTRALSINNITLNATGQKIAWTGRVFRKDRGGGSVHKVGFRFGTVVKAGGSGYTISLQDLSTSAGPPGQPDETQDQTVAISSADSGLVTNGWYQSNALSADRSVSFGDPLCVVLEFDGGGRLGSDSVQLQQLIDAQSLGPQFGPASKISGVWGGSSAFNNIILEFADGIFGTLEPSFPFSAIGNGSIAFKQDTAGADEYALEWSVPFNCKVDGFWCNVGPTANTSDFSVVLYNGTTAMTGGTVAIDANTVEAVNVSGFWNFPFTQEIELLANTVYRLAFKPTQTTNTIFLSYTDVADANHFQAMDGGPAMRLTSRLDLGSWAAATTTRRPLAGLRISSLDATQASANALILS